jgi:glycyl-tRNA synthetase (class II)
MTTPSDAERMEKIVSLCKRRGFIFQSSEIYGGLNGLWDYGPLGVELKRNLKNYWWRVMVHQREDVVGMDGAILTHPAVLAASGHVHGFADAMVDCLLTGKRFRSDQLEPKSGWVLSFIGAVDFDSFDRLFKEQQFPERSAIWSRVDLAPLLRQIFTNSGGGFDERRRVGYWQLGDRFDERKEALRALIGQRLFSVSSLQPFSAMEIGGNQNSITLSEGGRFNTAIKVAHDFYRKRGIRDPVVILGNVHWTEHSTRYNPENGSLLTQPRKFNLMFETQTGALDEHSSSRVVPVGPAGATGPPSEPGYSGYSGYSGYVAPHEPVKFDSLLTSSQKQAVDVQGALEAEETALAYLRPETAQSIFVQFKNILEVSRKKLPFGIAQIGKAFRNEINPRNFTFRSREFEQMELEYFCRPEHGMELLEYWKEERLKFYENIGISRAKLHVRTVPDDERAFYSKGTYDIEYDFPFGLQELEGVAYRTNYDLSQHQEASGKSLEYFDEETKQKFIPHVVEPSAGVDRAVLALICEAYLEDQAPDEKGKLETRVVLRFHPRIAPIKCAVFPLLKNKEPLVAKAKEIVALLRPHMTVFYDESGAIGRRYRRQDEIGTPFCVTVDFETVGERGIDLRNTVTLRDRDSMKQERIAIRELVDILTSRLH